MTLTIQNLLNSPISGRSEYECNHAEPQAWSHRYDGSTRPRFPLVYSKPEVYEKEAQKHKGKKKADFLRQLMQQDDEEMNTKANGQVTNRSHVSSIQAY